MMQGSQGTRGEAEVPSEKKTDNRRPPADGGGDASTKLPGRGQEHTGQAEKQEAPGAKNEDSQTHRCDKNDRRRRSQLNR